MISLGSKSDPPPEPPASDFWVPTFRFARKWMMVPAIVLFLFLTIGSWVFDQRLPDGRWLLFSILISAVLYVLLMPAAGLVYQAWREFQVYGRPDLGGRWVIAAMIALLAAIWLFRISGGALWSWMEIPVFSFSHDVRPAVVQSTGEADNFLPPGSEALPIGPLDPAHPVYRHVLDQDDGAPANFARDWRILELPCGTACQQLVLIHRNSRVILWGPTASVGARYSLESRTLIINPPEGIAEGYGDQPPEWLETVTYQLVDGERPRLRQLR